MQSKTESHSWFLLRVYETDTPDKFLYARDLSNTWDKKRYWSTTEDASEAYQFRDRSDARKTTRATTFQEKAPRGEYFWEVVKVVETKLVSYEVEFVVSNAPPLYQLARCGE
jgi:hypothetical protein